jgi:hypothetical protein
VFESPYEPDNEEMSKHLARHGDGVRDVAFSVEDIDTIIKVEWIKEFIFLKHFLFFIETKNIQKIFFLELRLI